MSNAGPTSVTGEEPGPRAVVPPAAQSQVWIDFDGTISVRDVLDDLILKYAIDDSWRGVEELWQTGRIGSRECLSREFALLAISQEEVLEFLDQVEIDPGFRELLSCCSLNRVPVAILSDGVEPFIRRILGRNGVEGVTLRANGVVHSGKSLRLVCPFEDGECRSAAAHCKCASVRRLGQPERRSIYIGDGRSDLCPARGCDMVFAKGALASSLENEQRPFVRFSDLSSVRGVLAAGWTAGSDSQVRS